MLEHSSELVVWLQYAWNPKDWVTVVVHQFIIALYTVACIIDSSNDNVSHL